LSAGAPVIPAKNHKSLDESAKSRQHGPMRGLICAAHIRNLLGEREAQKRKNPPRRAGIVGEAEEFVHLTVTKFPEIEPSVKRKQCFR
jgi:hypothetical protein